MKKNLESIPPNPVWNVWQGLLLILLVTLAELPIGWLNSQQDLSLQSGLLRFLAVGFGDCLLYFLVVFLFLRWLKCGWRDLGFVRAGKPSAYWGGVLTGVILFVAVGLLGNVLTKLVGTPVPQTFAEAVKGVAYGWEYLLLLLLGGVVAPLKEEMIFRGLIYPPLRSALGAGKGILVNGIFFAALHVDIIRFLPLFLGGVVLTWLYERTKSIWPSVLAHGTWNILMAVALWIQKVG
ncbi:MAG: CPBP family intramembrane metalloprotease [Peptococcaceae bacterium]|nr:CPBP family intramembrane metalloprotease [Peptococcaceae bacterium]